MAEGEGDIKVKYASLETARADMAALASVAGDYATVSLSMSQSEGSACGKLADIADGVAACATSLQALIGRGAQALFGAQVTGEEADEASAQAVSGVGTGGGAQ